MFLGALSPDHVPGFHWRISDELPTGFENVTRRLRLVFADHIEGPGCPTEEHISDIIRLAESLRVCAGKVLVHCEAGVSRSSAAALIMLIGLERGRSSKRLSEYFSSDRLRGQIHSWFL